MAQNIKLKRSSVAGKVPTTAQLEAGEIAINTADGKLYFERDDSTIQTIVTTNAVVTGSLNINGSITGSDVQIGGWGSVSASLVFIQSSSNSLTLDNVTDNGNTTTNNIAVGTLTSTRTGIGTSGTFKAIDGQNTFILESTGSGGTNPGKVTLKFREHTQTLPGEATISYGGNGSDIFTFENNQGAQFKFQGPSTDQEFWLYNGGGSGSMVWGDDGNVFIRRTGTSDTRFLGTASYATQALTSSYALTASYASNVPLTASYALQAMSSSYAVVATSASFATSAALVEFANVANKPTLVSSSAQINLSQATGTAALAVSASYALTATTASYALQALSSSYALTASYASNVPLTASYALQALSSSYALTASYINPLTQEVQITGSLLISGSTVQVGSNTLLGNTVLSGSIIISGSENPSTPTIQIFGDTQHTGVVRFNPIARNIDTSISASYIYVSGSTSDLYFSQNGDGYANTTRLRWLEGNLYTGLLNGGVITTLSPTTYQISSGSGIIVNLNASLNDNPYPVIQYLNWPNLSASIAALTASYQQAFVGVDSNNTIYAQGTPFSNGQFDTIINVGNVLFQNQSTINGVKTQPSVAYGFEQQQNTFNRAFGPLKLSGYTLAPSGSSTGSLRVGSGTAYAPGSNYIIDPNEPYYTTDSGTNVSKIFRYYQSGSSWVYLTNAAAGYTAIDPRQYSNNGVLSNVGNGEWSIQRVFWFPNSVTKAIVVYYGNVKYDTEADAIANISFESFVEAPNTAANAIYLGAIVIAGNGVFTNTTSYKIQPGGLFRQVGGSGGGGSLVTQTLSGLSDVNISAPTNYQALVYNTNQQKWINASFVSASISGNANTATTSTTASYALTASHVNTLDQDVTITRDLVVGGRITAEEFHTEFISSSIIFQSGSTKFGNSSDDTHQFTGSVYTTGKVNIGTVDNFGSDPDKFLALTGAEVVYRTGAQLLSDIGGQTAGTFVQNAGSGGQARYIMRYEDSNSATTSSIYETATGNIGIKKTTAGAALDINGSAIISGSLTVRGTAAAVQEGIQVSGTSTLNVASISTTSYDGAFLDYLIISGSNRRAGTLATIWTASDIEWKDTSTLDLGSTEGAEFAPAISGSNANLTLAVPAGTWTVKGHLRYM